MRTAVDSGLFRCIFRADIIRFGNRGLFGYVAFFGYGGGSRLFRLFSLRHGPNCFCLICLCNQRFRRRGRGRVQAVIDLAIYFHGLRNHLDAVFWNRWFPEEQDGGESCRNGWNYRPNQRETLRLRRTGGGAAGVERGKAVFRKVTFVSSQLVLDDVFPFPHDSCPFK